MLLGLVSGGQGQRSHILGAGRRRPAGESVHERLGNPRDRLGSHCPWDHGPSRPRRGGAQRLGYSSRLRGAHPHASFEARGNRVPAAHLDESEPDSTHSVGVAVVGALVFPGARDGPRVLPTEGANGSSRGRGILGMIGPGTRADDEGRGVDDTTRRDGRRRFAIGVLCGWWSGSRATRSPVGRPQPGEIRRGGSSHLPDPGLRHSDHVPRRGSSCPT